MRISPAAFSWLVRIDQGGTKLVDSGNGCIVNLRRSGLILYVHKANGAIWRLAMVTTNGKDLIKSNNHLIKPEEPRTTP